MRYLSNREISKLDRAITEILLRKVFFSQVGQFYEKKNIMSKGELDWILSRNIKLTSCHVAFTSRSKFIIVLQCCLLLTSNESL